MQSTKKKNYNEISSCSEKYVQFVVIWHLLKQECPMTDFEKKLIIFFQFLKVDNYPHINIDPLDDGWSDAQHCLTSQNKHKSMTLHIQ
jgi:hypothetical protein